MVETRSFGAIGAQAPGVRVFEQITSFSNNNPSYGSCCFIGDLKRGPVGKVIPCRSVADYHAIFGKPGDPRWHLFKDSRGLCPDAIDGFFSESGDRSTLFVLRNELDGEGTKAETTLYSRVGDIPVLKITAANEGRWGGYSASIDWSNLVLVTSRTFTIVAPEVKANQYKDGIVSFATGIGKEYVIIANTTANPDTGEVVFSISSQYDLLADGLVGPTILSGVHTYSRYADLTGSIEFSLQNDLTGTVDTVGTIVTGTGTAFSTELAIDDVVYFGDEPRYVTSISSDTSMTVDAPYETDLIAATLSKSNTTVTGTGTAFTTELAVGDTVRTEVNGTSYDRSVATIVSDTELTLTSGFPEDVTAGNSYSTINLWVEDGATGTDYDNELIVGDYVINPNNPGETVKVVSIDTAGIPARFEIEKQFESDFTALQVTKQANQAKIDLTPQPNMGLSVEIGQGVKYPLTHFALYLYFEGELVFSAEDVSLDPEDTLFVDSQINNRNVAYQEGEEIFNQWITVESLLNGAYTTAASNDVRPRVSNGKILALDSTRAYTAEILDPEAVPGRSFFPNPYTTPRESYRIDGYMPPVVLEGTILSNADTVTGTATTFVTDLAVGDYIYDPNTDETRKVKAIADDTTLTLESAFSVDITVAITPTKLGYFVFNQGYQIDERAMVGNDYLINLTQDLVGGYDGDYSNLSTYHWTRYLDTDTNLIETAIAGKQQGLVRIAIPGVDDPNVARAGFAYAQSTALIFRAEIPNWVTSAASAEAYLNQNLGRNDFYEIAYPSYMSISNPYGRGTRLVPTTGDIMGLESRFATESLGYHNIAAGTKAVLSRANALKRLSPKDIELLNGGGIQPIKEDRGNYIVYGNQSPSINPLYQPMHIRRIQSHYIRVFLELGIFLNQIFQPTSETALREIFMGLDAFFRREYRKGVLTNLLQIDDTYNVNIPLIEAAGKSKKDVIVSIVNGKFEVFARYVPAGITEKLCVHTSPELAAEAYAEAA